MSFSPFSLLFFVFKRHAMRKAGSIILLLCLAIVAAEFKGYGQSLWDKLKLPKLLQPDFGTACVFTITLLVVFFCCVRLTYPMAGIMVVLLGSGMAIIHRFPHALRRLATYKDALLLHPNIENAFHNYKLQESVIKGNKNVN